MEIYKFIGQGRRYVVINDEETKDTEILIKIAVLFLSLQKLVEN